MPSKFPLLPWRLWVWEKRYPFNVWPFPGLLTNPKLAIFICCLKPAIFFIDALIFWQTLHYQFFWPWSLQKHAFISVDLNTWPLYGCIAWPDEVDTIRRRSGRRKKPKGFLNDLGVAVEILCVFTITILWLTLECRHILLQWLTFWELGPRSPRI